MRTTRYARRENFCGNAGADGTPAEIENEIRSGWVASGNGGRGWSSAGWRGFQEASLRPEAVNTLRMSSVSNPAEAEFNREPLLPLRSQKRNFGQALITVSNSAGRSQKANSNAVCPLPGINTFYRGHLGLSSAAAGSRRTIKSPSARKSQGRHRPRCRDTEQCSPALSAQGGSARLGDSLSAGRSTWPWFVALSAFHRLKGPAQLMKPSHERSANTAAS